MRNAWIALAFIAGALFGALALPSSTLASGKILSYETVPEANEIRVLVGLGRLDSINFVDAQEDANAVRVNVSLLRGRGTVPADMKLVYLPVALQSPLGARGVLDAGGRPVPLQRR